MSRQFETFATNNYVTVSAADAIILVHLFANGSASQTILVNSPWWVSREEAPEASPDHARPANHFATFCGSQNGLQNNSEVTSSLTGSDFQKLEETSEGFSSHSEA